MKIVRFAYRKSVHWGVVEADTIRFLRAAPYKGIILTNKRIPSRLAKLLAPASPSKIILVGLNYTDHARELGMAIPKSPIIFLKPTTALVGPQAPIVYPQGIRRLDYEAELALVIRAKAKDISEKEAKKYILGYTCLNDVTARDLQAKDGQWTRAKSFDTFCPLGPHLETDLIISDLNIQLYLNGRLRQSSSTRHFIFYPFYLVSFISKVMTILPGDVISTGTPAGVGRMKRGDAVEVNIEGIGTLKNRVI